VELTSKPVPVVIAFGALAVVGVLGVAYLRARTAASPAAGGSTVALGAQVYQTNGCAGCHAIGGADALKTTIHAVKVS
jgi:mono/diheme cytochrome c family protein